MSLLFYGPGDLRLEEVPRPEPGPGDVLVQVEVALTDGTDAKAFRRGHPILLGELPSPFGHEFCGIDVATGAASSLRTPPRAAGVLRADAAMRRSARASSRC
jgi:threonine dehydrogenase-like Zn-dependent dehydrogenase